jgi:malonyl-CoA/methylmalonyl-CoA synthetase
MDACDQNVYAAFAQRFPRDGSRLFIEGSDGRRIAWGDVDALTARYAGLLSARGVAKGERVAGILEKSPEGILLYLAACRLGAIYIPISTGLTAPEIGYVLQDAGPKVVVCDPEFLATVKDMAQAPGIGSVLTLGTRGDGSFIAEAAAMPAQHRPVECTGSDPNAIVYTSGTTGKPKGAILTNGQVIWNATALAECWRIGPDDVLLHANPMAFGLFGTTTPVIAGGAAMLLLPKFDADQVIAALPRATFFSGVPTYYTRLLAREDFDRALCRHMRLFICGSAPMRADVFDEFTERTGLQLLDRYGLTESLIVTSNLADEPRRPDNSGLPLPPSQLRIVDETRMARNWGRTPSA